MNGPLPSGPAPSLDPTTLALWDVCRASIQALRIAVADYQAGGGTSALSRAVNESDVASGALARMSKRMMNMPRASFPAAAPSAPTASFDIGRVHAWAVNAVAAVQQGLCEHCGGIVPTEVPQFSPEPYDPAHQFNHQL